MSEALMFSIVCGIFLAVGITIKLIGPKETLTERRQRFVRKLRR